MEPTRPPALPADARYNARDSRWEVGRIKNGIPDGPFTAYRLDGTLLFQGCFDDGRLRGAFRSFSRDGRVAFEATYEEGQPVRMITLRGDAGSSRSPSEPPFTAADPRAREVRISLDDESRAVDRIELDDRGREVIPGIILEEATGRLDARFLAEHPEGFLSRRGLAAILRETRPKTHAPRLASGLHLAERTEPATYLTPTRFEALFGLPMPVDLAAWLEAVDVSPALARVRASSAIDLAAWSGDGNLVEAAIADYQRCPGRALSWASLTSGLLPFAELVEGIAVHLGLGVTEALTGQTAAVYPIDLADATMPVGQPVARSLDDLAYLLALAEGDRTKTLARGALIETFERLRGRVDFPIGFEARALPAGNGRERVGDLEGDHREGFAFRRAVSKPRAHAYRARWLSALWLGQVELAYALYVPDFDAIFDASAPELEDAIATFPSTATYAVMRAFFLESPDLTERVATTARSGSRFIRDAGALAAELERGRNAVGALADVRATRDAFNALRPREKKANDG